MGPLAAIILLPTNASVIPYGRQQFNANALDAVGDVITPPPAFVWSATGGTITLSGLYVGGGLAGGPFQVSASTGGLTGTASLTVVTNLNLAPQGTGCSWYGLVNPTDNAPQVFTPGLNDGDLVTDVSLVPYGANDNLMAYEAAGILWTNPQSINQVVFFNGAYTADDNGVFAADFGLQFSTDGLNWSDAGPEWSLTPAYNYNSPDSGDTAFTFSGGVASVLGVRCVGQVHTTDADSNSWYVNATEVQTFAAPFPPPPALTAGISSNGLSLAWPASASNFFLECTPCLVPTFAWSVVTNVPQLNGSWLSVTLPSMAQQQFFRLHQP